jgi:hypothetical protein
MADNIVISAIAKVVDQASGPMKAIANVIKGVGDQAKETTRFFGKIGGEIKGAIGGLGDILGKAGGAIGKMGQQSGALFGPLSGLTGLLGVGGITKAITDFSAKAVDISRTARALGVTTDALQQFRLAAGNADVADTALTKLRQTLIQLNKGGKATEATVELLGKMGVNAEAIKAGKLEEILPLIAKGFEENVDPQQQAAAAQALFGKSWAEVLPLLQKGTAGLAEGAAKFKELGIAAKDIAAGKEAAAAMKALGAAVETTKDQIAAAVLPVFVPMVKAIADFVRNNGDLLKQVALPAFIAGLATAIVSLGIAVAGALGPWGLLATAVAAAAVALYQNWGDISKWIDDNFGGVATTLGEVANGIVASYGNIFSKIKAGWQEGGLIGAAKGYFEALKENFTDLVTWFGTKGFAIDWSTLGLSLSDAFNDINWQDVGERIGKALGDAVMWYVKANIAIGEWLLSLDWAEVGAAAGKLFVDSLVLLFWTIPKTIADLMREAVTAAAKVDWGEVLTAITVFFGKLGIEMLRIGSELIKGLIKGMMGAIAAGFGEVTGAISSKLSGLVPSWLGGGGSRATPAAAANDNANLLQRAGTANAAQAPRSNVGIDLNVNAPPGSTVSATTSQSGAPVDVDVGRNTMTAGAR